MTLDIPLLIDSSSHRTLTGQICDQLLAMIRHGRLRGGDVLPASRDLCLQLGVSRNTVVAAYADLNAQGYLEAFGRGGTRIALATGTRREQVHGLPPVPCLHGGNIKPPAISEAARIARRVRHTLFDPMRNRLPLDFRVGLPDSRLFPREPWAKCIRDRLSASALGMTDYVDPAGVPELRSAISHLVRTHRGVACTSEQVIVTSGVQQGLDLVCRLLLDPGVSVLMENPTYGSAREAIRSHGATLAYCRIASDGIDTDALPASGARMIYVTPSHQFPMGNTMSLARRLALLEWARNTGTYIVEDDYDSDFRYRGAPLSALASLDNDELVIYLGTFSKTLGAGLRLGYMIVPPALLPAARALKDLADHGRSWLEQVALADFINLGHYESHVRKAKTAYRARCKLLVDGLSSLVPGSEITGADGGMHLTWILPLRLATADRLRERLSELGVVVYTLRHGPAAYEDPSNDLIDRVLLLGYPCLSEAKISSALKLIETALSDCEGNENPRVDEP
jgi:GntR family transcriptional regulator / MocR family aminotransferase